MATQQADSDVRGSSGQLQYVAGDADPINGLPKLHEITVVCPECGSNEVVSQPAHDLRAGREAKCTDCGHSGRVKTNRYGRVTMLRGFRIMSGRLVRE